MRGGGNFGSPGLLHRKEELEMRGQKYPLVTAAHSMCPAHTARPKDLTIHVLTRWAWD